MARQHFTAPEFARYAGIKETELIRAICNRGTIDGVSLPESLNHAPLSVRVWLREDVMLFTHTLNRARAGRKYTTQNRKRTSQTS